MTRRKSSQVSIEDVDWSVRAWNRLHEIGVETLGEVASMTEADLLRVKNLGRLTLREIQTQLAARGIYLTGSDWRPGQRR